jgi:hypothetical protein
MSRLQTKALRKAFRDMSPAARLELSLKIARDACDKIAEEGVSKAFARRLRDRFLKASRQAAKETLH